MLYGKVLVGSSAYLNLATAEFFLGGADEDKVEHTNSYSKYVHTDESYTKISADGMERFKNGTGKKYHYLSYTGTGMTTDAANYFVNIQLPDDFIGKEISFSVTPKNVLNIADDWAMKDLRCQATYNTETNQLEVEAFCEIQRITTLERKKIAIEYAYSATA